VSVRTSQPVIIQNANIRSRGTLIDGSDCVGNLTVRNVRGHGLNPTVHGLYPGRFLMVRGFANVVVEADSERGTQIVRGGSRDGELPGVRAYLGGERIDWYECPPVIEEYHKTQKTGCGIEGPQFTTRPATEVVNKEYVRVLNAWRFKRVRRDLSVKEFLYALAKLGGHLGRRHDKRPGWRVSFCWRIGLDNDLV